MEILALLPIVWLIVYLMTCSNGPRSKNVYVDINTDGMEDERNYYHVVSAYKNLSTGECFAGIWEPEIQKRITVKAKSKEELRKVVQDTYQELHSL